MVFFSWTIATFNVCFTAFPPIILGLFDKPSSSRILLKNPELYQSFQNLSFSNTVTFIFKKNFFNGINIFLLFYLRVFTYVLVCFTAYTSLSFVFFILAFMKFNENLMRPTFQFLRTLHFYKALQFLWVFNK